VDPDRKELLESLGYIGGSDDPSADPDTYPDPREALPKWVQHQKTKGLYRKAMAFAVQERYKEAVALFDSVLVREQRADVYYNRGMAYRRMGNKAGFRSDLERALRMDDTYIPALKMKATLAEETGRSQEAHEQWVRILEMDTDNASALRALAEWHAQRGEWDASLPYLRSLVNQSPESLSNRYNLGYAAAQAGRNDEARTHLETFLRIAPGDSRAAAVRELLAGLPGE
jgi:tetratricopeptide (TPR) repeat protein